MKWCIQISRSFKKIQLSRENAGQGTFRKFICTYAEINNLQRIRELLKLINGFLGDKSRKGSLRKNLSLFFCNKFPAPPPIRPPPLPLSLPLPSISTLHPPPPPSLPPPSPSPPPPYPSPHPPNRPRLKLIKNLNFPQWLHTLGLLVFILRLFTNSENLFHLS